MHFIYKNVNQFYNFKGVHAFKEKLNPEWSPRYLIYRGTPNLAQAWLEVTQVNAGSANLFLIFGEEVNQGLRRTRINALCTFTFCSPFNGFLRAYLPSGSMA